MRVRQLGLTGCVGSLTFLTLAMTAQPALAADRVSMRMQGQIPAGVLEMKLESPLVEEHAAIPRIDPALMGASGRQEVLVRLRSPSVGQAADQSPGARIGHREKLKNEQAAFTARANKVAPGSKVLGSTQLVLNALVMDVDAGSIRALAGDPDVLHVHKVRDYELDLSDTVPYIGASAHTMSITRRSE